jgi:hypothetical protein
MKTKNSDLHSLFERFEEDIEFDCHSLRAKVSRSEAGKQIIVLGPRALKELASHLKGWRSPSQIHAISEEIKNGWGILLSWMCEEHSLERKGIAQSDFASWVGWTTNQTLLVA